MGLTGVPWEHVMVGHHKLLPWIMVRVIVKIKLILVRR